MVGSDQEEKINLRKIASIFGMGLGDEQSICGIILGCLIILSKRYGRDNVHEDRFQIYNRVVSCKEKIIDVYQKEYRTKMGKYGKWWASPNKQFLCKDIRVEKDEKGKNLSETELDQLCRTFCEICLKAFNLIYKEKEEIL